MLRSIVSENGFAAGTCMSEQMQCSESERKLLHVIFFLHLDAPSITIDLKPP